MKALTVRQPHAQLIAFGVKTIETRTKPTKYRGPLLIHAGKHVPDSSVGSEVLPKPWTLADAADEMFHVLRTCPEGTVLPLGAIVASCKLVDCVPIVSLWPSSTSDRDGGCLYAGTRYGWHVWRKGNPEGIHIEEQRPYGDFTPGRFAWLLEDIKPTTERCPACWGAGARAGIPSHQLTAGDSFSAPPCPICHSKRTCDPIPAKGKQGLWEWTP